MRRALGDLGVPDGPVGGLSIEAAALRLGVGRSSIYKLLHQGTLRFYRVGRRRLIPIDEVARFIGQALEGGCPPGRQP